MLSERRLFIERNRKRLTTQLDGILARIPNPRSRLLVSLAGQFQSFNQVLPGSKNDAVLELHESELVFIQEAARSVYAYQDLISSETTSSLAKCLSQFDQVILPRLDNLFIDDRMLSLLLASIHRFTPPDTRLIAFSPNRIHYKPVNVPSIEHILGSRASGKEVGFSWEELAKLLLNAGWLPDLVHGNYVEPQDSRSNLALLNVLLSQGVSHEIVRLLLGYRDYWTVSVKIPSDHSSTIASSAPFAPISVIVPVTRPWQAQSQVLASPGLQELSAEIIIVQQATNAADAFQRGSQQAKFPWRLMLHQDAFLPRGSGRLLAAAIDSFDRSARPIRQAGFFGLIEVPEIKPALCDYSGTMLDRTRSYNFPSQSNVCSLDEFAILLHAESLLHLDAELGWHLWATDLCLQSRLTSPTTLLPTLNVPIFHNTVSAYEVPREFYLSAVKLLAKYPQLTDIPTVCGNLVRNADGSLTLHEPVRVRDRGPFQSTF